MSVGVRLICEVWTVGRYPFRAVVQGVDAQLHDDLDGPEADCAYGTDDGVHGDASGSGKRWQLQSVL
jgi:hypothetical protein